MFPHIERVRESSGERQWMYRRIRNRVSVGEIIEVDVLAETGA